MSALLPDSPAEGHREAIEIDADLLEPSPVQPRTHFDNSDLQELALSIRANGVIQPILARLVGGRYQIVAGERRWRAAMLAGLTRVPVVLREVPDDRLLEIALIENIQREELRPIEEANAYRNLIETLGLTQEEVASRVGRDRSSVANFLRLLRLPSDIQELLENGRLSPGHARALLVLEDVERQREMSRKIIEKGLSVRQAERAVKNRRTGTRTPKGKLFDDPNTRAAEAKLRRRLGTQVKIFPSGKGAGGKLEIAFYSLGDLDRIYRILMGQQEMSASS